MRPADFRSDTVTRPSPAMRLAMAEAEVGDDVLDGDPTVRRLERRVAEMLGKEEALFVPSGTMANQVALGAWTRPGDEIVAERSAHVLCWEAGAAGALHGLQSVALHAESGALDPDEVRSVVRLRSVHCPRTALVCVEQTFMGSGAASGGRVVPLDNLRKVQAVAQELEIPVHMDGARLFNAVAASGILLDRWAACADSVSVALSKCLGAPVGALIAGDAAFAERARLVRKRLGGWMRQAGGLAAAGLYALDHNLDRLKLDHDLARALAAAIHGLPGISCPPEEIETNIVMARIVHPSHDAFSLAAALADEGVLALPMSPTSLRFVAHLDVGLEDVQRARTALQAVLAAGG